MQLNDSFTNIILFMYKLKVFKPLLFHSFEIQAKFCLECHPEILENNS